jgi:hypothetical protein
LKAIIFTGSKPMNFTWPSPAQLDTLNQRAGDSRPITMLNLLRYRAAADYTGHPQASPCSGKAAYARYAEQPVACIGSFGGRMVFGGAARATTSNGATYCSSSIRTRKRFSTCWSRSATARAPTTAKLRSRIPVSC